MRNHSRALDHWLRPGRSGSREIFFDVCWLLGLGLLVLASGMGLRDPWPADEPRFALIARDMVRTGQWLIPSVGGDIYADKPPLFFWMIAVGLKLTGSLRVAFLLPSLLASLGSMLLTYDLGRRLWNREAGFAAGLALLFTWQFAWQARQAQIDATVCFFITLGCYGILRHLLLGPAWRHYTLGWAAAGLGVITKGVGFLPLLLLIPYVLTAKWRGHPRPALAGWKWLLGPVAFVAATAVWLLPMLLASLGDPAIAAYRDEILFHQTVDRYARAWHHQQPFWFFIVEVIPGLWLPLTALLPWLIPRWRDSLRQRDLRILLPLAWIAMVVIFFSASPGKRGVYVLPAVPALALICGPWIGELIHRPRARATLFVLALLIGAITSIAAVLMLNGGTLAVRAKMELGADLTLVALTMAICSWAICIIVRPANGFVAFAATLTSVLMLLGFWAYPLINPERSGESFVRKVEDGAMGVEELGLVAYKEQYLLEFHRPTFNFGHARWREADREAADAAAWLYAAPNRALMIDEDARKLCFAADTLGEISTANGEHWYLARAFQPNECAKRGSLAAARRYDPAGQR